MAYRVIVIEDDQNTLDDIVAMLRRSPDFTVSATYKSAHAAINPAAMFHPDLFLANIEDEETLNMMPDFVDKFPGAYMLGTMSQWDPLAAQKAMEGGATGCILKPFTAKEILEYLQLYSARGQRKPPKLISFFSPKGRAGRTTLAAILALLIAEKTGERVALIDADLQFGDLPIFFDLEPNRTVVDATQDIKLLTPVSFAPYFYPIKDGVSLLSSPDRPEYAELVAPESLTEVVMMAGNIFRYVLVDLPSGFNPVTLNICRISNVVFVTTMINSGFEVKHAKKAMEMFEQQDDGRRKVYTVFTRVNPFTEENRQKIADQLSYPVDVMIPNEYKMISVANSGRLAKGLPMDTLLMKTISDMADKIIASGR
ncbi:MAG: P-loop NTPase [Quinella sp. 3Q1]|nr:P-loop NTPase [Quinella sp. 3Q1]MBR3051213.1 P-loop NTPase [Selenomonadaceae bacterium]MBR6889252.1 P-loop NTPase [Selenomonadaceae bacterium]